MSRADAINVGYLVTIVTFILALKFLSSPKHARLGIWFGAAGMVIAVGVTFAQPGLTNYASILIVMAVFTPIGWYAARAVKMTAMPQMVALFNGVGGGAAALVALAEFHAHAPAAGRLPAESSVSSVLSALIGSVSFAGSMIAFGKLQDLISGRPIVYPGQKVGNAALLAGLAGIGIAIVADMPVVISLLNAATGIAASATGFVLHENVLIVSGMLVGASGTLLTLMMARAMGRSVTNVLFGAFGQVVVSGDAAAAAGDGQVRSASAEDVAVMLAYARRVIIIPGYGLAVAQAQHDVRKLADELERRGVDVRYAIHPVAGRMPGHMNVLLAEANVPYDQLYEMDDINSDFPETDVALVIGANDVTNPAARNQPGSPIYGMPILDVDRAKNVVVIKRSMNPGFAGIDNPLYRDPKTVMLFADAKDAVAALVSDVKGL